MVTLAKAPARLALPKASFLRMGLVGRAVLAAALVAILWSAILSGLA